MRGMIMDTNIEVKLSSVEDVKRFVNITSKFKSEIDAVSGRYIIDAKSILGMFSMNLILPFIVEIHSVDTEEILKFNKEMEVFKTE